MPRTLAAPLVVLALIIAAAPAAGASTVASQRAQAAAVMHRLDLLQARRDVAAAHETTARAQLTAARAAEATTAVELAASRRSLDSAQSMLAQELVATYKNGGGDPVAYVLAAGSFSDLLSRVDVLRRADSAGSDLITQINATQRTIQAQEQAQRAAVQQASTAAQEAATARTQLDTAIAGAEAVLAHVNASIQTLLAGERKRRTQLADTHGDGSGTGGATGSGGTGGGSGGGSQPPANVFYGESTWYGPGFAGHRTADGEIFNPNALTCASPWLPFNTQLRVTNLATGLSVQVRVNDRGPFGRGVLDLSAHAAQIVHLSGWQRVRIQILP
ncbi:MAG TPA: septal ring lytic transglycosylase RlpA family protein [Gaiellales bacterium]|nr:septal ring lytic transglycosylase RlpA family protein [Gaiellales bacterium]